jgi:uncharacterized protein
MIIDERRVEKKRLKISDTVMPDNEALLEGNSFFKKDVSYSITLVREMDKIKVSGGISTELSVRCMKCLEYFDFVINSKFDTILYPLGLVDFSFSSLKDEEMEYIFYSNGKIDIERLILEQVNLNIPYKTTCSRDCKGICPMCGTNLNYEQCKCDKSIKEINIFNNIKG